jgi:hypothetical protein
MDKVSESFLRECAANSSRTQFSAANAKSFRIHRSVGNTTGQLRPSAGNSIMSVLSEVTLIFENTHKGEHVRKIAR